jgi:hypothetical protein
MKMNFELVDDESNLTCRRREQPQLELVDDESNFELVDDESNRSPVPGSRQNGGLCCVCACVCVACVLVFVQALAARPT